MPLVLVVIVNEKLRHSYNTAGPAASTLIYSVANTVESFFENLCQKKKKLFLSLLLLLLFSLLEPPTCSAVKRKKADC